MAALAGSSDCPASAQAAMPSSHCRRMEAEGVKLHQHQGCPVSLGVHTGATGWCRSCFAMAAATLQYRGWDGGPWGFLWSLHQSGWLWVTSGLRSTQYPGYCTACTGSCAVCAGYCMPCTGSCTLLHFQVTQSAQQGIGPFSPRVGPRLVPAGWNRGP